MPLITTNLKVQFETDNAVVSPTSWIDEIAGIELTQLGSMSEPALRTGAEGTPTGAPYFSFDGSTDGLGTDILAGEDVPDGAESRTMYVVVRYPTGSSAGNFHGVVYGNNTTRQAFGVVLSNTEKVLTDFWSASFATADSFNDNIWHVIAVTFDGADVDGYIDNVNLISGTPATLNTVLSKLYINYKLSNGTGALMDCAAALIYAGAHDTAQLTEMNAYLRGKYIETPPPPSGETRSGAVVAPAVTASGAGVRGLLGAGAVAAAPATVSGSGLRAVSGSGAVSAAPAATSVAGLRGALGSASLTAPAASVTGAGERVTSGVGAVAAPASITSGQGARTVIGTGAVDAPAAVVIGTGGAVDAGVSSGVGAVTAPGAVVSGTGVRSAVGSGAVASPAVAASGAGVRSARGAGAVASAPATASGAGTRVVIAIGAAVGPAVIVAGQGVRTVRGIGDVTAPAAVVDGRDTPIIPVAIFRDTAIWDDPHLTATWDEPRLDAVWDEPRFTALWRQ